MVNRSKDAHGILTVGDIVVNVPRTTGSLPPLTPTPKTDTPIPPDTIPPHTADTIPTPTQPEREAKRIDMLQHNHVEDRALQRA